jgi:hypothetical protein
MTRLSDEPPHIIAAYADHGGPRYWLLLLALMLLIPALVGVQTWREVQRTASADGSHDEAKPLPTAY